MFPSKKDIWTGINNPAKAVQYAYKKYIYKRPYLIGRAINQKYYNHFREPGSLDVMAEDWDTLLLIDACRYDYFEEVSDLPGSLNSRLSPGSMSWEFIEQSFIDGEFHDTVYVTANPFAMEIESGTFHDVVSLIDDYYKNDIGTVPAEVVSEAAQDAHERYPHKRIIVHYMQPHEPFLSEFGQQVSEKLRWAGNQYHLSRDIGLSDIQKAYKENVEHIVNELREVIPGIDGKIVVSSDHGELLGERLFPIPIRGLEHPALIREDAILNVPWLEIEGESRREIRTEQPKQIKGISSDTAEKRLKQLGYL